jgi:hypothetical protein
MNPETKTEVPTPGLTEMGVRNLERWKKDRRREECWTAFCWLAGIALVALLLWALHPFVSADHFIALLFLSPIVAVILGIAVWTLPEIVRYWPVDSARAHAKRIRDERYQCRRLTRLLIAFYHHGAIPACEIEAAWQALSYARDCRNGPRHVLTHEDGLRLRRAEAMYRVWKAEYDRQAPERAIAEAQAEMGRAIARSADWRAEQD